MKIAVFGLGYVGTVTAACLAEVGHEVIGVDIDPHKVELVRSGVSPVVERELPELVEDAVRTGQLTATTDATEAVLHSDLALICVGTPSAPNGSLSTQHLEKVVFDIGQALRLREERYLVVVRSTVVPGTSERLLVPILEEISGMVAGTGFGFCTNPEFLREGTSAKDFREPPKTVIGMIEGGEQDAGIVLDLYRGISAQHFIVPISVAEMVKYVDNGFHAVKVAFANEIGSFCRDRGIDSDLLMEVFTSDTKLNISPAYLRPGMPFGGSCLPKDLRALVYEGRHADLRLPMLESVLDSNERHADRIYNFVAGLGHRRVAVFGLSFKAGTDDLRESPMVELCERLLGRGHDLMIYDPEVSISELRGANRRYVEKHIPHLSRVMTTSADAAAHHGEVHVLARATDEVIGAVERTSIRPLLDLARNAASARLSRRPNYESIV